MKAITETCLGKIQQTRGDNSSVVGDSVTKTVTLSTSTLDDTCPICHEGADNNSIHCDICKEAYHQECCGMSKDVFAVLVSIVREAGWVCLECRTERGNCINSLRVTLTKTVEKLSTVHLCLASLKDEIDEMKSVPRMLAPKTEEKPRATIAEDPDIHGHKRVHKTVMEGTFDGDMSDPREAVKVEICKTITDLSRRKKNVVISGLPEPSGDQSDDILFSQFCEEHMTTKPSLSYLGCRRLGRLPDTHGRPRRLLVHLNKESCAEELLKAARHLRNSSDPYARSIYINPDLDPVSAKLAYEKRVRRRQQRQQQQQQHHDDRVFWRTTCSPTPPTTALSGPQGTTSHSGPHSDTASSFQNCSSA